MLGALPVLFMGAQLFGERNPVAVQVEGSGLTLGGKAANPLTCSFPASAERLMGDGLSIAIAQDDVGPPVGVIGFAFRVKGLSSLNVVAHASTLPPARAPGTTARSRPSVTASGAAGSRYGARTSRPVRTGSGTRRGLRSDPYATIRHVTHDAGTHDPRMASATASATLATAAYASDDKAAMARTATARGSTLRAGGQCTGHLIPRRRTAGRSSARPPRRHRRRPRCRFPRTGRSSCPCPSLAPVLTDRAPDPATAFSAFHQILLVTQPVPRSEEHTSEL